MPMFALEYLLLTTSHCRACFATRLICFEYALIMIMISITVLDYDNLQVILCDKSFFIKAEIFCFYHIEKYSSHAIECCNYSLIQCMATIHVAIPMNLLLSNNFWIGLG